MSFADDYIDEPVSEVTRRRLEMMIAVALLNPNERWRMEEKTPFITEADALIMINELREYMPIMGLHSIPLDMRQQYDAIQYQVAKDDLHEQRWRK